MLTATVIVTPRAHVLSITWPLHHVLGIGWLQWHHFGRGTCSNSDGNMYIYIASQNEIAADFLEKSYKLICAVVLAILLCRSAISTQLPYILD